MLDVSGNIHASGTIKSGSSIVIDGINDKISANSLELHVNNSRALRIEPRMARSNDFESRLNEAELDVMDYSKRGRYRIRLVQGDIDKHRDLVLDLLRQSYEEFGA